MIKEMQERERARLNLKSDIISVALYKQSLEKTVASRVYSRRFANMCITTNPPNFAKHKLFFLFIWCSAFLLHNP